MGCNTSTTSAIPKQADAPIEAADMTETQNKNNVRHSSDENQSELPSDTKEHTPSSRFKSPPPITDAENSYNGNGETVPIIKKGPGERQGTEKYELVQEELLSLASVSDGSKNISSTLTGKTSSSLSTQEQKDAIKNEVVETSVYNIVVDEQSSNPSEQHVMDLPKALPLEPTNQNSSPREVVERIGSENSCRRNIGEESPEIKEDQEIVGTQTLEQILHSKDRQRSMEKSFEVVHEVPPVELSSAYEIEMEHGEIEQRPSSQVHPEKLVDPPVQDSNSFSNVNQLQSMLEQEKLNQSDVDQSKSPVEENTRNHPHAGQSKSSLEQDKPCVIQSKSPAQQEAGNPDSVCHQERFNQGLRSFCRLVDSKELLGLADPHVSILTLERAPAGQGFPFKKFLLNLTGITELNLSGNQLGPQAFRVVAMAVCHNKTIQSLDLSKNLSDTDSSECLGKMLSMNSSLINLNVSSNQLGKDFFSRCVGPALGCNKTLKTLSASSCGISNLNVLLDNLLHNSSLEELDISHNNMTDSQDFAQRLKEVLQSPSCSLKTLHLRNCGIGNEGMRLLMEALGLNRSLEMLHAGGNMVTNLSELTSLIVSCIKHPTMTVCNISDTLVASQEPTLMVNGNLFEGSTDTQSLLTSLNVAKCSLTDDIITSLANSMPGSLPHLSELDLTGNTAMTTVAFGALSTLLSIDGQSSNLKHLHLGSLSINGLCSILQGSSTWAMLHTLDLKRSKVTPSDVSELGSLFQRPSALIDLYLEGLKLSGSDALIGLLASSGSTCSLQSLSLAGCALQDSDLQPITTAVSEGLAIHTLRLSANRITDEGAVSLMESFLSRGDGCPLVELNLSNNRLTDESADTAAKMLVSMPGLRLLLLGHNALGGEGLTTIVTALNPSESSSLRILDVSCQDSHLDETDLVDLLSLVAKKLGYMKDGDDCMTMHGRSPLPSHPHGLTIRLTGLGGSPDNGQSLDSVTVKTDYTRSQSPSLSLQHVLEIADWLKGSLTEGDTDDCSMTAEEWSQVIGLAKDPSVPSWLQVSAHRSRAIYLTGLPASVSANKMEGDLESEADCLVKEVCILKDFIQRKPNGIAWVLLADNESVHKALNYFYEGKALMFSQPYIISCIKLSVTANDPNPEDENKASRDLAARAQETAREDAEHRALLVSSYQASQERHEYAKANPAYADGRIW